MAKKEIRDIFLRTRISRREFKALERMASQEGRSLSEMSRELLREGALRRGVWPGAGESTPTEQPDKVGAARAMCDEFLGRVTKIIGSPAAGSIESRPVES